jgi:hypothetical protein
MREISSSLATASYSSELRPFKLVELMFDNGPVRLWNGNVSASFMGNTFYPTYGAGTFSNKKESGRVMAEGMELSLGLHQDLLGLALEVSESYQGRIGKCYIAFADATGSVIGIDNVFTGRMSQFLVQDNSEAGISITLETHMVNLNRSDDKYYTKAQQTLEYPSDTSFRFKDSCPYTTLSWGTTKNTPPQTSPNPRKYPTI